MSTTIHETAFGIFLKKCLNVAKEMIIKLTMRKRIIQVKKAFFARFTSVFLNKHLNQ